MMKQVLFTFVLVAFFAVYSASPVADANAEPCFGLIWRAIMAARTTTTTTAAATTAATTAAGATTAAATTAAGTTAATTAATT